MIKVTIGQKTYEYEDGTTLYEIAREHQSEYKHQIILAKCNGTLSELSKVLVKTVILHLLQRQVLLEMSAIEEAQHSLCLRHFMQWQAEIT